MIKIIAEIGINHHGSLKQALKLIRLAKDTGCWGVKFQYRNEKFFSKNDEMGSTLVRSELSKSNFQLHWIDTIIEECKKNKIKIGMSFFRKEDLEFFSKKNKKIDFIKIPSPEFRNIELIKMAKKLSRQVIVSYGAGNEKEIKYCIKKSNFRKTDCIMHCISNYPTSTGEQQMEFLGRLKKISNCRIGYSSHDEDWEVLITSFQYGINFVERHFCESKKEIGLDISSSSDVEEFKKIVKIANSYTEILYAKKRVANQGEILNARNLGCSLFYKKSYKSGKIIRLKDMIEKSPATGLRKNEFIRLKNHKLINDVNQGEVVIKSNFIKQNSPSKKMENFMEKYQISLPVRLHDFKNIRDRFGTRFFEMHLSYDETKKLSKDKNFIKNHVMEDDVISIHLPDYIDKDNLIDPFSKKKYIVKESKYFINTLVKKAIEIEKITNNKVKLVGSFSVTNGNKEKFYNNLSKMISYYKNNYNVEILAQWLPKKAWYFGGSAILEVFCNPEDLNLVKKFSIPLCLDISHLILSANYFNENWEQWYKKLVPLAKHIHLSDGEGISGEGVKFGSGDLRNINNILNFPGIKVLEVWEGHHNNGEKFFEAIKYLIRQE